MAKKNLPPLDDHPIFRELVKELKKQSPERLEVFKVYINDGIMRETTNSQKKESRQSPEIGHNS